MVLPGDCCRAMLLNHLSKEHLLMCAAEQKLWGWRGTRAVPGRKGKRLDRERMGCFKDTRQCWSGAALGPKGESTRLNRTRLELRHGGPGSWQGAVMLAEQHPSW